MYEKKLIPNSGNIIKSHSFQLKPLKTIYVYNGIGVSRRKDYKNIKHESNEVNIEILENKLNITKNCFKEKLYDTIWLGINSILIRLEAINEDNFEFLISTIERQHKEWEITKIIDESFLKIQL